MKKILLTVSLLFAALSLLADNTVRSVDVRVALDSLGGAKVVETWNVVVDSDNTEWYLAMNDMRECRISGLSVRDTLCGLQYETLAAWDVNRTRAEKAGRCGIVAKSGGDCELCWGVSSDGPHVWEVSYRIDNLVVGFVDSCAFNHMFISDGLASPPEAAKVTISYPGKALTDDVASIWSFGYDGYAAYSDGEIVAESNGPLDSDEGIIVMAAFDRSLFSPTAERNEPFASIKDEALRDSDYTPAPKRTWWERALDGALVLVVIIAGCVLFFLTQAVLQAGLAYAIFIVVPLVYGVVTLHPIRVYFRRRRCLKGREWRRDVPEIDDLARVPYILNRYSYNVLTTPSTWDNNLTAAYLMALVLEKGLKLIKTTDKHGKDTVSVKVVKGWTLPHGKYSEADGEAMKLLYKVLKGASGADLILQKKEISSYKKTEGRDMILSFYNRRKLSDYTRNRDEAAQVLGFQAFLRDFTLSDVREIQEVELWDQYLVYATLFGVADRVMKSMKDVVPGYFDLKAFQEVETLGSLGNVLGAVSKEVKSLSQKSAVSAAGNSYGGSSSRYSGGGGFSSHSGGSGHTGGGGGGGR